MESPEHIDERYNMDEDEDQESNQEMNEVEEAGERSGTTVVATKTKNLFKQRAQATKLKQESMKGVARQAIDKLIKIKCMAKEQTKISEAATRENRLKSIMERIMRIERGHRRESKSRGKEAGLEIQKYFQIQPGIGQNRLIKYEQSIKRAVEKTRRK